MKMGASFKGRKSWDDLSQGQKEKITQNRQATNFKRNYMKWKDGQRDKQPMFFKENPIICTFLQSMGEVVEKFNGNSDENRLAARENKLASARKYYAKQAQQSNKGRRYVARGPQPSRIEREQEERIDKVISNEEEYKNLSEADKLKAHEKNMILSDIKKGWRCVICKKMFTLEEEEDATGMLKEEYMHKDEETGQEIIVYYHTKCRGL